jgi:hypothetical protein
MQGLRCYRATEREAAISLGTPIVDTSVKYGPVRDNATVSAARRWPASPRAPRATALSGRWRARLRLGGAA